MATQNVVATAAVVANQLKEKAAEKRAQAMELYQRLLMQPALSGTDQLDLASCVTTLGKTADDIMKDQQLLTHAESLRAAILGGPDGFAGEKERALRLRELEQQCDQAIQEARQRHSEAIKALSDELRPRLTAASDARTAGAEIGKLLPALAEAFDCATRWNIRL